MIELMNIALLEVNARRRVEVIADGMRDARRDDLESAARAEARARLEPSRGRRLGRVAGHREPLTGA